MTTYKEALRLIKTDFKRYHRLHENERFSCIKVLMYERGFRFSFWWRLAGVRGVLKPFFYMFYWPYSNEYGIQINTSTEIGGGLYIGHGMGVVINPTAKIGKNFSISQFCTIGSNHAHAATIGDNVYLAPNCCIVEDVKIGDNAIIGAGSVVTHDIPANAVAVGSPAKVIRIKS